MKKLLIPLFLVIIIGFGVYLSRERLTNEVIKRTDQTGGSSTPIAGIDIEIVAEDLDIPWELVFLPDGRMLVTERPGNLLIIGKDRRKIPIQGVAHVGEGGLLGMALHPKFSDNHLLYLYSTTREGGTYTNRVERYRLENDQLSERTVILSGIRGSSNHDGGRLAFGPASPDSYLYITTGDAENSQSAQDKNSLNGKILRVKDDGSIPPDNPFGNAVYSYGHRNVQGIAWDDSGQLWATEHGPSGLQTGNDELNKITKGSNYGWPAIKGNQTKEGMAAPVANSGSSETWAPSGMTIYHGKILFAGLRGEAIYSYPSSPYTLEIKTVKQHVKSQFGRLRTIVQGPEGYLYVLTNNTDGRGTPKPNDDKIIKVKPEALN